MEFDVLIRNGLVYDGSGGPPARADVGVRGDRIEAVGDLSAATGATEVDAAGRSVAPGFIDAHTHSDLACFLPDEHLDVKTGALRSGVTTEVAGNCGFSPFPYLELHRPDLERLIRTLFGTSSPWADLESYRDDVRQAGLHANLAPLVGHGSLRAGVVGFEDRPAEPHELAAMVELADAAFEQGAFGLSSGLVYTPGVYADTGELVELCRALARHGRPYATHMRGETDMVVDSVREALHIGREGGVPVHVSHHKAAGQENWGRTEETLGLMAQARAGGVDVTLDVYPYTAGSTLLYALLPPWAQEGGADEMVERLRDSRVRERIRHDLVHGLPRWENLARAATWDGIFISSCPGRPDLEGRPVVELADAAGADPPGFVFDLLISQQARVTMILHSMSEADVSRVLAWEGAMIGSDGIPLPGKPHPRWAGTSPRVLGRYAREQGVFDLATAIRKLTSLPAERFGLADRGVVAPGKAADLVVFDAGSVLDLATFEEPLLSPAGLTEVMVNGRLAVAGGELTGAKAGRVLSA